MLNDSNITHNLILYNVCHILLRGDYAKNQRLITFLHFKLVFDCLSYLRNKRLVLTRLCVCRMNLQFTRVLMIHRISGIESTHSTPVVNSIPGRKRNYTSKILKSKFALGTLVSGLMDSPAGVPVHGKFHENWRVQTAYRSSNTRRARPACKPSVCDSCRVENGSCSPTEAAPARAWIPNTCSCYPVLPESTESVSSSTGQFQFSVRHGV